MSCWKGSVYVSDFTSEITKDGQVKNHAVNNERFYSFLRIVKVDQITGETVPQKDVGFKVYDPNGNVVVYKDSDTWHSDEDGIVTLPFMLEYGEGYDRVYEADVDCSNLEDVFKLFNLNLPAEYTGRCTP